MTRCSLINCACLNCRVLCSKTLVGALMKLAAIQNDVLFSVIKVDEACPSEFGPDVKKQLRLRSKYECFCLWQNWIWVPPIGPAEHDSKGFKAFMTCQTAKMTSLLWNYPTLYAVISLVHNFSFGLENKNICILVVKIQKSFFFCCWWSWFNREHQLRGSSQQDVWVKPRERKVHVWCHRASLWNLWSKFHIDL